MWQPIETMPRGKEEAGKGFLITWIDPTDLYDDGTWGPDQIEFTFGYIDQKDGKYRWWNMNSGNIMHFRTQPTHWAPYPTLPPDRP